MKLKHLALKICSVRLERTLDVILLLGELVDLEARMRLAELQVDDLVFDDLEVINPSARQACRGFSARPARAGSSQSSCEVRG